jgi:hypothetical protein
MRTRQHAGLGPVRAGASVALAAAVLLPGAAPAAADEVRGKEYWLEDYGITPA